MTVIDCGIEYEDEDAEFFRDGTVRDATLSHDVEIQGISCAGGRSVIFYESGALKIAWLSKPAVLDHVPCLASENVFFHENGRLMNANLGRDRDFTGLRVPSGARVTLDEAGELIEYYEHLSADVRIDGIRCSALFGVGRYASGGLSVALLASAIEIDGKKYVRSTKLSVGVDRRDVTRSLRGKLLHQGNRHVRHEEPDEAQEAGRPGPEGFKGFVAFDEAAFNEGAIPLKYKELMAVAVALTTQCPYCIDIHSKKAKKAGATEQELAETTLVAAALRAGGAVTHGTHTLE